MSLFLFLQQSALAPETIERQLVEGTFYPRSVKQKHTSFGPRWEYRGMLALREGEQYPVTITLPRLSQSSRPDADSTYHLEGHLFGRTFSPHFVPLKKSEWILMKHPALRINEARFKAKQLLKKVIRESYPSEKGAIFLEGISTGDLMTK